MQDAAIHDAQTKYQAWVARNAGADLEIVDISTEARTTPPVASGGRVHWYPTCYATITVKFYGRAISP